MILGPASFAVLVGGALYSVTLDDSVPIGGAPRSTDIRMVWINPKTDVGELLKRNGWLLAVPETGGRR